MMAIQILGQRRYERAVPEFEEIMSAGQDVYILREIAYALSLINTNDSRRLMAKLRDHPSPIVRKACDDAAGANPKGVSR